jgi:ABC-type sugar transport system ATPase subunit
MGAVTLTALTKHFGDVTALDDVTLTVADGESLVVLGPSGSGKSTLLRVVAGLEPADTGRVEIDGVDQAQLPPHRRDVAIVFQHFALYPHLSARENITVGLRHGLKLSKTEAARRAAEVAERLAITPLLSRRPRTMSGGQRQRVALARALARRAGVVLLDEPLSGLDAQLRLTLRAEIAALLRETGAASLHVTHDQNDAMALADRIAVVRDGRIEQLGTPQDLYRRPASVFVASFIGSPPMNLLATSRAEGAYATPFGRLPAGKQAQLTLGIRPEQLVVGGDGRWQAPARVALVEQEGPSKILHVEVGEQRWRARTHPDHPATVGENVVLACDPAHVQLFDTNTGLSVGAAADLLTRSQPVGVVR